MLKPVDATTTPAWTKLTALHDSFTPDLRGAFETDPERAQRYGFELGDLYVDLSKNFLTDDVRDALVELAEQVVDRVQHRRGVRLDRHPIGRLERAERTWVDKAPTVEQRWSDHSPLLVEYR